MLQHRAACFALLLAGCAGDKGGPAASPPLGDPVDLLARIDPKIGTGGIGFAVGSGYPGAAAPMALVRLSPDTADRNGASFGAYRGGGYHADDVYIQGFSHLHLSGVGLTDYGLIALMPRDGMSEANTTEAGYRAPFSHAESTATAGRYAVTLREPDIGVELSATDHTGLHRYRFGAEVAEPTVLIDLGHVMDGSRVIAANLTIDPATGLVRGALREDGAMARTPFTVWFTARFSPPPVEVGVWDPDGYRPGDTEAGGLAPLTLDGQPMEGTRVGAWLRFDAQEVNAQVALSLTDAAGADANLAAQSLDSVDAAAEQTAAAWADWLSPIRVWGGTEVDQIKLATALYKCLLMPHAIQDVDGRYRGFDAQVHHLDRGRYTTDLSMWDTYRTTHPLYTLLWPEAHRWILRSLARMSEQGGALPKWPLALWDGGFMVGSPAHVVIGEAVAKGLDDVDEAVLFAMAADMALGRIEAPYGARPDVSVYDTYGYYPSDLVGTSVSWTQEVALADYALALGGEGWLSAEDQARLAERAHAWKPLYDAELGYFHARDSAGAFQPLNSTTVWGDEFSEGNAEQYRWLVPHDPEGLAEIMGGEDIALQRLDAFFEASLDAEKSDVRGIPKPYYWAGNEHDLQVPFLFSAWGQREQTARWAGWALDTFYGTGADGYPGNDDGGAMAAWVVWTVIGLYPMAGTDRYFLGEPRFSRVELDLPDGTFVIERSGTGPVRRVELDGEALPDESLRHDQLRGGSVLHFVGSAP